MKTWWTVLAAIAFAGFASAVPAAAMAAPAARPAAPAKRVAVPATPGRAMWIWSPRDAAAITDWATGHGVGELFAYVSPAPDATELASLRDLSIRAHAAGIRLAALGGEPGWATSPDTVRAWRTRITASRLFDGVHLDVEPYLLSAWTGNRSSVVASYLAMLDAARAAGPERLEVDVPFWYGTIALADGRTLADAVLPRVDAVTVMSYRDSADGMSSVGADMLGRAGRAGKPVRLAAETRPLADCGYCTFAQAGSRALQRALTDVDTASAKYPTYAGVAVHDFDGWRRLPA
jgi:hypothetical protein